MARGRSKLALVAAIFLAGSLVMLFFVILSAVRPTTPLSNTYFLEASTGGITGARSVSRWTYFYICGADNLDCGSPAPALPFGSAWSADPSGAPLELVGSYGGGTTSHYFFYMWRFGWVFYLIALFFSVLAFFASFLACCGRLGSAFSGLVAGTALFFETIAVSLMTATFVKARNAFQSAGRDAHVGTYAFGFSWGSWAALLIATALFFVAAGRDRGVARSASRRSASRKSYDMSGRRVKDDYA